MRFPPAIALTVPMLLALSMVVHVNYILRAHQLADAAANARPRGNLSDLYPRWLGARELLRRGRDPYSDDITREIQAGYYGRAIDASRPNDPKDQQGFAYPLYVVFLLAPTVGLPFPIVQRGFLWLLVVLTASSIPLWFRVLRCRAPGRTQAVWIVLTLGSFPAIQGFKLQQLTLLVCALIAAACYAVVTRHFIFAGVLLAFASIKPQLVFLVALWMFVWVLGDWGRRQGLLWSFVLTMVVLFAGSEALLPGWVNKFRHASAAYYRYTGGGRSVLDVALTPTWGRMVSAVVVIVMIICVWRRRHESENSPEFHWMLALVLATTLVVIPMFAPYNQLLLLPALLLLVSAIRELWNEGRTMRFLVAITAIAVSWPWLAALLLVIALTFLPAAMVQRAWAVPLYTSLAIPITTLALVVAGRRVLCSKDVAVIPD